MSEARVIQFPTQPTPEATEVRVADCDNGYTRIANELLEAVLLADLTVRQLKVVIAVIRKTYGFNKKTDRITNTQIAILTGIHHTHICKTKNELLDRNILVMNGREIGVNNVVSEWKTIISQNGKTLANSANKTLANSAKHSVPTQLNTKDILKDNKDNSKGTSAVADAQDANQPENQPPTTEQPVAKKPSKAQANYQAVVDAYHRILPDMKQVRDLTDTRKTKIRNFFSKYKFSLSDWEGYLTHISQHCRWMFERRPRQRGSNDESYWKAKNFDFLLTERCYLGVLEGTYCDN